MSLITNNISGSFVDSWKIGITGSVKFGNPGGDNNQAQLPDFPGTDVSFFVSGSRGGKDGSNRTVAVFGGDAVISGSLTIGTGSITITSNEIQFGNGSARIFSGSGGLTFVDSSGTKTLAALSAGGGGSGTNFFYDTAGAGKIYTTASSVAFTSGEAGVDEAADKGTDVVFYVSGSTASGGSAALFGGNIVTSGSIRLGGNNILNNNGSAQITFAGTSNNDIRLGWGASAGALDIYSGEIRSQGTTFIQGTGQNVQVLGDLTVSGGKITLTNGSTIDSETTDILKLTETDVRIIGPTLSTDQTTFNLVNDTATTVNFAGAATSLSVGATTGNTTVRNNLTVAGDLTVRGTTTTIDTNQLVIEDPLIYFASGSASSNQDGGIAIASGSSVTHQAMVWGRVASDTWGAGRQDVTGGTTSNLTSMTLVPIRASKFEVGGTGAFLTSSNGNALTASIASSNPLLFSFGGIPFAELLESGVDAKFGAVAGKNLILSGTNSITMVAGANGTTFQRDTIAIGSISGVTNTSLTLAARNVATNNSTLLTLSGSSIIIGANSASTEFRFADVGRGLASNTNGFTLASQAGINLNLSGSNNFLMRHGSTGIGFFQHSNPYLSINSGSVPLSANTALIVADTGKSMLVGGASTTIVSGSDVFLDAGAPGVAIRKDSSTFAVISSPSANTVTIAANTGYTTANVFNAIATTVNFAGAGTDISVGSNGVGNLYLKNAATNISGSLTVAGAANLNGSVTLGDATGDDITFTGRAASNLLPKTDIAYDLGAPNLRWRNMYTGDLHLRNDRGDWTIIEERDFLSITNNHTGIRYKFLMQEI